MVANIDVLICRCALLFWACSIHQTLVIYSLSNVQSRPCVLWATDQTSRAPGGTGRPSLGSFVTARRISMRDPLFSLSVVTPRHLPLTDRSVGQKRSEIPLKLTWLLAVSQNSHRRPDYLPPCSANHMPQRTKLYSNGLL